MKLKLITLCALFAAGVFASLALANDGKHAQKAADHCQNVHLSGTIAPQTLAVTVDKATQKSGIAAGSQVSLAVGSTGQTVRLNAEACATGTGTALVLTVKQIELRVKAATTASTTTSTTAATETTKKHGDEQGKHHVGGTTTTGTITIGTTTTHAGTTTTTP